MTVHIDAFDRYQHGESLVHRLDPRLKIIIAVAYVVSNSLLPDGAWEAFFAAWLFLLAANVAANLGAGFTLRRSLVALPFAVAAVTVLFLPVGEPLFGIRIGGHELAVTDAGLLRFSSIIIRTWLSIQMAILLVSVTQFPDLIHGLEHLRVPKILTTVLAFLYRYLFVLTDEVLRLSRARQARSAGAPGRQAGRDVTWRARVTGNMAGQLFLRSYERSDRIYQAMLARGYQGNLRTMNPHRIRPTDWAATVAAISLIAMLQLLGRA